MNIGIRPSANFKEKETGCKSGDTCLILHFKVDEKNQTKGWKKANFPKRRESEDNGVVAVKSVSQLGSASQDALVCSRNKRVRRDPMQKVLNTIRKVRFIESTLRQASRKRKDHRWVKQKSFLVSEALRSKNRGSVPRREWTTTGMCQKKPTKKWVLPSA